MIARGPNGGHLISRPVRNPRGGPGARPERLPRPADSPRPATGAGIGTSDRGEPAAIGREGERADPGSWPRKVIVTRPSSGSRTPIARRWSPVATVRPSGERAIGADALAPLGEDGHVLARFPREVVRGEVALVFLAGAGRQSAEDLLGLFELPRPDRLVRLADAEGVEVAIGDPPAGSARSRCSSSCRRSPRPGPVRVAAVRCGGQPVFDQISPPASPSTARAANAAAVATSGRCVASIWPSRPSAPGGRAAIGRPSRNRPRSSASSRAVA